MTSHRRARALNVDVDVNRFGANHSAVEYACRTSAGDPTMRRCAPRRSWSANTSPFTSSRACSVVDSSVRVVITWLLSGRPSARVSRSERNRHCRSYVAGLPFESIVDLPFASDGADGIHELLRREAPG